MDLNVGARAIPSGLTVKDVLSHFGSKGKRGYREFVEEGIKGVSATPWDDVRGQAVMGSQEFIEEVLSRDAVGKGKKTQVVRRRELMGISPEAIMAAVGKYYDIEPQEMKGRGQRYTEPKICGELFDEAPWNVGTAGDRRASGSASERSGQCGSTGYGAPNAHHGEITEGVGERN